MTGNAPTAARLSHAEAIDAPRIDATAFRQGWRVRTRLDALLADGRIDATAWQSATEYRDGWSRVHAIGGRSWGTRGAGADPHARLLAVAATMERLLRVQATLGPDHAGLIYACVVEDRSWASIASRLHVRRAETARDRTVLALRALAWAWSRGPAVGSAVFAYAPKARRRPGCL
jgi:hypothetical protein